MAETLLEKIKSAGKWIALAAAVPIVASAGYLAWLDNKQVKESIIQDAQAQILETGVKTAQWMENVFNEHSVTLESLAENPYIRERAKNKIQWKKANEEFCELANIFNKHKGVVNSVYMLSNTGIILDREPFKEERIGESYASRPGVKHVLDKHESYISDVFQSKSGDHSISIIEPIFYDNEFVGMLRFVVDLKLFDTKFFKHTPSEKESKIWVLDSKGRFVVHPRYHHVGENPLVTAKKEFKDHELKSYATLIDNMKSNKRGVGIYQTACFSGETHEIIKKYIGFTPIQIGNKTWSVAVCRDYNEILNPINRHTRNMAGIGGLLALLFAAGGYGLYRTQKQKAISETEKEIQKQATKQWQNTFDAIEDMIVIVDKDRKIVKTNQAVLEYLPEIHLGSTCYEIFHGVERLPEGCISCKVFETGEPTSSEYFDPRLKVWFNLQAYPIKNSNKQVEQLVHVFRDITLQKKEIEEKGKLELQLQRSEKMEAIGTLAGGVAHDLNNVLGGLVSYPELILMQIPEEDVKLKKQILIIQKSGQKAAAIVQDLLTLARRGVVTNEVVNLNDVINDYLQSPEFDSLKTCNPNVKIETDLKRDLLNILGSSVHLSKTIMNLISNAAEAINDNGIIMISSDHQYIDKPIRGYDEIEEGNYVVIKVADDGIGIPAEHINKIFEPFYTKKKMGRSGTGLGMAVVWGTVKDHKGYIDIQSNVGEGTTFSLYFPVTQKEIMEKMGTGAIEDYIGNGESILVVDDVEEQRQIASGMLKELDYSVVSVSSGEEAIEYLKTNKADLLVLDMIMDPGMDGLDSYKKILEIHPGQKAIIVSGFSETDRVKELQSLGAGAYIRKPFLLEKIGLAVKKELEK